MAGTDALKTAVTGTTPAERPTDIFGMLKVWQPEIQRALPRHMNPDRVARIAMTEIRRNPVLGRCEPLSLFAAVISSAQMGLEIGMGRCFLVPYRNSKKNAYECQLIPGWKGLVELANRSGRSSCWTGAVFKGDRFDYQMGDTPFVRHVPMGEDDPAALTHVYAVGRVKGSDWPVIEVWPIAKVKKHRDRYNRQGDDHYSFREPEMYARKIPLLQVLKYLPSSPELEAALILSNNEHTGQSLTLEGVLAPDGALAINEEGSTVPPEGGGEAGGTTGQTSPPTTGKGGPPTLGEIVGMARSAKTQDSLNAVVDMARGALKADELELAMKAVRDRESEL